MSTPESRARVLIDAQLRDTGWRVQDRAEMNLGAGLGVAVREFQMGRDAADYGRVIVVGSANRGQCGPSLAYRLAEDFESSMLKGRAAALDSPVAFPGARMIGVLPSQG